MAVGIESGAAATGIGVAGTGVGAAAKGIVVAAGVGVMGGRIGAATACASPSPPNAPAMRPRRSSLEATYPPIPDKAINTSQTTSRPMPFPPEEPWPCCQDALVGGRRSGSRNSRGGGAAGGGGALCWLGCGRVSLRGCCACLGGGGCCTGSCCSTSCGGDSTGGCSDGVGGAGCGAGRGSRGASGRRSTSRERLRYCGTHPGRSATLRRACGRLARRVRVVPGTLTLRAGQPPVPWLPHVVFFVLSLPMAVTLPTAGAVNNSNAPPIAPSLKQVGAAEQRRAAIVVLGEVRAHDVAHRRAAALCVAALRLIGIMAMDPVLRAGKLLPAGSAPDQVTARPMVKPLHTYNLWLNSVRDSSGALADHDVL